MNGSAQSDYIVYVDESGDHGLASIDPSYPVFVLAFCIFKKRSYCQSTVPSMQELKFKYFGHDMVVLHEREIRKALPPFQFLVNQERRTQFMAELTDLVRAADFTIIASAIHKRPLQESYAFPASPYDLAMKFCLERLQYFLVENGEEGGAVHVVFEDVIHPHRLEGACADVQCHESTVDAFLGQSIQQRLIEVQPRGRCCDGPVPASVDGLVALAVT